ncbi:MULTISPECIES: recombinase family protein, partial [unclassified Saccharicrinis]|uniref:recombinase family protein n=1 Tax=unclassified Saccharicrinis TaxID=2646859 RepID=UPI003D33718F
MKIGYARVSTRDQKLELQIEALEKYGCEKIFKETKSAVKERPELEKMLDHLRDGDVVVVWKLDRLGRSLRHLIDLVTSFRDKGVEFVSLNDSIDTTTAQGRLTFNIFASFAEFERELIRERTMAGLKAAREKGRVGGRKPGLSKENRIKALAAYNLHEKGEHKVSDILKLLKISKASYYRYIEYIKEDLKIKPVQKTSTRI